MEIEILVQFFEKVTIKRNGNEDFDDFCLFRKFLRSRKVTLYSGE